MDTPFANSGARQVLVRPGFFYLFLRALNTLVELASLIQGGPSPTGLFPHFSFSFDLFFFQRLTPGRVTKRAINSSTIFFRTSLFLSFFPSQLVLIPFHRNF